MPRMLHRESSQLPAARGRQVHFNDAAVGDAGLASHQARPFATGYEGDHPVRLCLKSLRDFSYGGPGSAHKSLRMEQQLILQNCNALIAGGIFAEP